MLFTLRGRSGCRIWWCCQWWWRTLLFWSDLVQMLPKVKVESARYPRVQTNGAKMLPNVSDHEHKWTLTKLERHIPISLPEFTTMAWNTARIASVGRPCWWRAPASSSSTCCETENSRNTCYTHLLLGVTKTISADLEQLELFKTPKIIPVKSEWLFPFLWESHGTHGNSQYSLISIHVSS